MKNFKWGGGNEIFVWFELGFCLFVFCQVWTYKIPWKKPEIFFSLLLWFSDIGPIASYLSICKLVVNDVYVESCSVLPVNEKFATPGGGNIW